MEERETRGNRMTNGETLFCTSTIGLAAFLRRSQFPFSEATEEFSLDVYISIRCFFRLKHSELISATLRTLSLHRSLRLLAVSFIKPYFFLPVFVVLLLSPQT